jgi:hypothetical protein
VGRPAAHQEAGSAAEVEADFDHSLYKLMNSKQTMARSFARALVLILVLAVGCAGSQGFDRVSLTEALHIHSPPSHSDEPISNQGSGLSRPLRLGVFFVNHDFPNRHSIRKVEWLSTDRDHLLRLLAPLQDGQILADTFVLMDVMLRADNIRGIRQAGARYGADVVLIVDGIAAIDRYNKRRAGHGYRQLMGCPF